jgi:lysophospholipase L1-like esterase
VDLPVTATRQPGVPAPGAGPRVRNLLASLALSVASLLGFLGLLELGVRLFVPEARWRFEDGTGDWRLDDEIGWVHRPNVDVTTESYRRPVRFRTNADGLIPSGVRREKAPGILRVMLFGDSMLVGRGVPQDEIYSARLESLLRERGMAAEVVSAGVQGHSTDQALLLMQRFAPTYRADLVVYGSTLNDLGGNAVDHAYGQAKPRFRLDGAGRLRFAPPQLASEIRGLGGGPRTWIQRSALYRVLHPGIYLLRARLGGYHEVVLLGDLQELYVRRRAIERLDWTLYGALLARMREVAEREGSRFFFFQHPDAAEVWPPYIERICERFDVPESVYDPFAVERRLAAVGAERGVDFVPTVQAFRDAGSRGPFHLLPYDPHLSPAGHARLAEVLADAIEVRSPSRATR